MNLTLKCDKPKQFTKRTESHKQFFFSNETQMCHSLQL